MSSLLFARRSPGAATCVAIGGFDHALAGELQPHREILWVGGSDEPRPPAVTDRALHTVDIVRTTAEIAQVVNQFVRRSPRHLPTLLISRDVLGREAERYSDVIGLVHQILDQQHRARQTREKDGFRWQCHLLENLSGYAAQRLPDAWRNALQGLPAFVCGAGPSLDVSASCIAAHAEHAVIFSADSALRALAKRDVRADFAVSIDAAKVPEKCLPTDHLPQRVILSAVSPSTWLRSPLANSAFFLSSNQLTLDWLATHGVARTALAATENCGSTALDLARFLGCAPIYLFGLDLALDAANPAVRHHEGVDASIYTESGFDAGQPHPTVPGNYTDRVSTFAPTDWRALDERLAGWPAELVVNVNDRGARFRNTTLVHPREFVMPQHAHDKTDALSRLPNAESCPAHFQPRLREVGESACREIASLRTALATRGPAGAIAGLRQFFADKDAAQAFGAYSLKIMPHLLPPTEGDASSWSVVLDEFAELAQLAANQD